MVTDGVPVRIVAAALRFYLEHPGERARIGSPEGLARLQEAIGRSTETDRSIRPRSGRALAVITAICVLVVLAMIETKIWSDSRFGDGSTTAFTIELLTTVISVSAAGYLLGAIKGYRHGRRR